MTAAILQFPAKPAPEPEPTDAERMEKFLESAVDQMMFGANKIKVIAGLDAALMAIGKIADELKRGALQAGE